MMTVIQRVLQAEVRVEGKSVGRIGKGALCLLGVFRGDTDADAQATAAKIAALRFFAGTTPMDRTLAEVEGACLLVSQFTLAGSLRKGNRPSFDRAEEPSRAEKLYLLVAERLRAEGLPVETGRFGAQMEIDLVGDGPVTLILRTAEGRVL